MMKNMDKLKKAAKEVLALIAEGKSQRAVDKMLAFKGKENFTRFELTRGLIAYAQENNKYDVARCARDAFEKMKQKAPKDMGLYYDVANGYQVLYDLTVQKNPQQTFECQDILDSAVKYFEKAS